MPIASTELRSNLMRSVRTALCLSRELSETDLGTCEYYAKRCYLGLYHPLDGSDYSAGHWTG